MEEGRRRFVPLEPGEKVSERPWRIERGGGGGGGEGRGGVEKEATVYGKGGRAGEGSFGSVLRARDLSNGGRLVALKYVPIRQPPSPSSPLPQNVVNELILLEEMGGTRNVCQLAAPPYVDGASLVFPLEYCRVDLARIFAAHPLGLREDITKSICQQILRGVAALHARGVLHRDLKPSNVLLNEEGCVKLADLGMARRDVVGGGNTKQKLPQMLPHWREEEKVEGRVLVEKGDQVREREEGVDEGEENEKEEEVAIGREDLHSPCIGTRWYRAPEVLYGSRKYSRGVDLWSVGLITGEALAGAPLAPGETDIDQIRKIHLLLGQPTTAGNSSHGLELLPDFNKISFTSTKKKRRGETEEETERTLDVALAQCSEYASALVEHLLQYDAAARGEAVDLLTDSWFFVEPSPTLPLPSSLPSLLSV